MPRVEKTLTNHHGLLPNCFSQKCVLHDTKITTRLEIECFFVFVFNKNVFLLLSAYIFACNELKHFVYFFYNTSCTLPVCHNICILNYSRLYSNYGRIHNESCRVG